MDNIDEKYIRTAMLIGAEGLDRLQGSCVVICGVGGVGSYAAEALARAGVGKLILIDYDRIAPSNINRQIHSLASTVGMEKVNAMKGRIGLINPDITVEILSRRITESNIHELISPSCCDYVIDALDTVSVKLALAEYGVKNGVRLISSMGMANKLFPEMIELDDIRNTSVCPLAKVVRAELKKRGVTELTVCYSKEKPIKPIVNDGAGERRQLGSVSFVPAAAGLIIAGKVVRDLIEGK